MKEKFLEELRKIIGARYALGGGQMEKIKLKGKWYKNKDKNGNWVGYDCCGGIMRCIMRVLTKEIPIRSVTGMMDAEWVSEIKKDQLSPGDLIFVDIPARDENGDIERDEMGYPVYGKWNHVMTYIGETDDGNIITTEGPGGDFRLNKKSRTVTKYWKLESFQKISSRIFKGTTRYQYMRIDWKLLEKNHQA